MSTIDEIIAANSGLVYAQLHKFHLVQDPEAESIAFEALYNAILNYDKSKGNALSTVATVYIYNALGSYVRHLNRQRQIQTVSYHNMIDSEGQDFTALLATDVSIEDDYIRQESLERVQLIIEEQFASLTNPRHKLILGLWKESDFTALTTEIAKKVGVSQSYVSQVINNFKFVLRKRLEGEYYG